MANSTIKAMATKAEVDALSSNLATVTSNVNVLKKTFSGTCNTNGWTDSGRAVYAVGHIGFINVNNLKRSAASGGWSTALTLPSGITCKATTYGYFANDSTSSSIVEVKVNTDGAIQVYSPAANVPYWGCIIFPCDIS